MGTQALIFVVDSADVDRFFLIILIVSVPPTDRNRAVLGLGLDSSSRPRLGAWQFLSVPFLSEVFP